MIKTERAFLRRNLRTLHCAFIRHNVDTSSLYRELDICPQIMQREDSKIDPLAYLCLLEKAAEYSGNEHLGMDLAVESGITDTGIFGYMLENADSLLKVTELIDRYVDFFFPELSVVLETKAEKCIWKYRRMGYPKELLRQDYEMIAFQMIGIIRHILKIPDWKPEVVFFELREPKNIDYIQRALGCKVIYNYHFSGAQFPKSILNSKLEDADHQLLAILEAQAKSAIGSSETGRDFLDQVRNIIITSIGEHSVSSENVAFHLNMTRRTLHRKLKECGFTFSQLRENIRMSLAKECLAESNVSITELSLRLGYTSPSSFIRAFNRWTSFSPQAYRNRMRSPSD